MVTESLSNTVIYSEEWIKGIYNIKIGQTVPIKMIQPPIPSIYVSERNYYINDLELNIHHASLNLLTR
jgi:hypothetical protein